MDNVTTIKMENIKGCIDNIWNDIIENENNLQIAIKQYEELTNFDYKTTEEFKHSENLKSTSRNIKNEINIHMANIKKNKNEIKLLKQQNIQMARQTGDSALSNEELRNLKTNITNNVKIIEDKEKENNNYNIQLLDKQIELNSMQLGNHNKIKDESGNIKILKNNIKILQKNKRTLCNNIIENIYNFMNGV
jgi:predicted RNase H-like nuclease (RuvC/YqgF family)